MSDAIASPAVTSPGVDAQYRSADRRFGSSVEARCHHPCWSGPKLFSRTSRANERHQSRCRRRIAGSSSGRTELLEPELPDRLEHPISRLVAGLLSGHDRAIDESGDEVEHAIARKHFVGADILRGDPSPNPPSNTARRRHNTRSGSDNSSKLQSTAARSVCCRGLATRLPVVSSRKRSSICRRICSTVNARSRTAASSIANGIPSRRAQSAATASPLSAVSSNPGERGAGTVHEEVDGLEAEERLRGTVRGRRRHGQGRERHRHLPSDPQRLAARREDPHARTTTHQRVREDRRRVEDVFAVVQDQQEPFLGEELGQRPHEPPRRPVVEAERRCHRLGEDRWIPQVVECDHDDPVGERAPQIGPEPQSESASSPRRPGR